MSYRRIFGCVFFSILLAVLSWSPSRSQNTDVQLVPGRNVNMVSGTKLPGGDPYLQRQNEPSIAVSSRNPMHVFAGANDYRTVDMSLESEVIPGYEKTAAARDAWLGVYKSIDGGQSWKTYLLPGFPQDTSAEGLASPLKSYDTAADPVVRAGTNGLFYYSGIALDRGTKAPSAVFVARFIDNNNKENGDPIQYINTRIIDKGNAGQFIDKPWIAVDIPRAGAQTVALNLPGVETQNIPAGNVYLAYSRFTGNSATNPVDAVYFSRSTDLGNTWSNPTKLSEGEHINQGAVIAIDPNNGYVYVAWRRFKKDTQADAIVIAKSTDGGKKFSKAGEVAWIQPFDQGSTPLSFRTNSYPSMVVDSGGVVYIAWAQRKTDVYKTARIVISTSTNGTSWSSPAAINDHGAPGHQFMPTLGFAAGRLVAAWFDQREDISGGFSEYMDEKWPLRHTIDVYMAEALPGNTPYFGLSKRVSRYLYYLDGAAAYQNQWNRPNLPMFKQGTTPFHGDYIDIAPSPFFLPGSSAGSWVYNTDSTKVPSFHLAWADNRDVEVPVPPDNDWVNYTPPNSSQDPGWESSLGCLPGKSGKRNQNVYMSTIAPGLILGSPGNVKPLTNDFFRTFVVYVQNTSADLKTVKLTILAPSNISAASFKQNNEDIDELQLDIAPFSSISRTVYAKSSVAKATLSVKMTEVGGSGQTGIVLLNGDATNPKIVDPDDNAAGNPNIVVAEVHTPNITNPNITNPNITNPNITNPNITNPNITNPSIINPNITNPNITNPNITNPNITNPGYVNPNITNPNITNPNITNASLTDQSWTVTNIGNTASSYAFNTFYQGFDPANYPGFGFQLLIYKVHTVPTARGCDLKQEHYDELIANIVNPNITNPNITNPNITNPNITNATLYLGPGEEAWVTLRVFDPDKTDNITFDPALVTPVVYSQAVNTAEELLGHFDPPAAANPIAIVTTSLPSGTQGTVYSQMIIATGGLGTRTWSYSGTMPGGLTLDSLTGVISGTPSTPGTFNFTVQAADSTTPTPQSDAKSLSLRIYAPLQITTGTLSSGIVSSPYSATLQATGGTTPYAWSISSGSLPNGLLLDPASGTISGTPTTVGTSNFTAKATDSSSPQKIDTKNLGISVVAPPPPEINITQAGNDILAGGSFDFGTVALVYSKDIFFTIHNTGGSSLTISGINITETGSDQFEVTQQPSSSVQPGETTIFIINFHPTSEGAKTATISIGNNDSNENPYDITLNGIGTATIFLSTFDADTVGSPPQTGGINQPASLRIPSSGGSILVRSAANGIVTQPVEINDADTQALHSVAYSFNPIGSAFVIIEATVSISRWGDGHFLETDVTPSTAVITRLGMTYDGRITYFRADGLGQTLGTYQPNTPFRVRITVDMLSKTWSIAIDDEMNGFNDDVEAIGLAFQNDPNLINSIGAVNAALWAFSPGATSIAYDDIWVYVRRKI